MLGKKLSVSLIIVVVLLFVGQSALADKTYTTSADFDEGDLVEVNHDPPDQLQLNITETTFSFVNVPATARGTIVRIDAESGDIIGEYRTAPGPKSKSPSRTGVDSAGNVWVANQGESGPKGGSVVKIGIVIGGTRVDADGTPNPSGQYLAPPYDYSTCVDRDEDGLIMTSRGLTDILLWPEEGVGEDDGIVKAWDECILLYQRLPGADNPQHVSVDANDDVWVGGYPGFLPGFSGTPAMFYKLDGEDASVLDSFDASDIGDDNIGCGGFGGLIDDNGILWSASQFQNKLLHYNPGDGSGACIDIPSSYGLVEFVDEQDGDTDVFIWNSSKMFNATTMSNEITKIDASDPKDIKVVGGFPVSTSKDGEENDEDRGVAVTGDGNVWVAKAGLDVVRRLSSGGAILSSIPLDGDDETFNLPTGLSVDANGKVWVATQSGNKVMRIDPTAGGEAVDLTVELGPGAAPDAYSDMISNVTITTGISPQGTWTVIHDSGTPANEWDTIVWNTEEQGSEPPGTVITVEARASDTGPDENGELGGDYIAVGNGVPLSLNGQFIQIRATLESNDEGDSPVSPVLSDLSVTSMQQPEGLVCDLNEDEIIDIYDILGIYFTIGDSAREPFDPRDYVVDGAIKWDDVEGCIYQCTYRYCLSKDVCSE